MAADLATQQKILEVASKTLADNEEKRAKAELIRQAAEFDAFKAEYNVLKARYDVLVGKLDTTGALSTEEQTEMDALETAYLADKGKFDAFEADRIAKERDNQQKALNKAKAEAEAAEKELKASEAQIKEWT